MISVAFAQAAAPAASNPFLQFVPLILIGVVMYVLILRPTMKKNKEHRQMLEQLKRGDEVWTSGGIFGVVDQVDGHTVKLKISEETTIKMLKAQISAHVEREKEAEHGAKTK